MSVEWIGVRTLQRRLHAAGLARTLGYSDPAHFTRAFQRWMGSTPCDFRERRAPSEVRRCR